MYLESLELQGFKSFPDKIKLRFGNAQHHQQQGNFADTVRAGLGNEKALPQR